MSWNPPVAALMNDGRLHLQQGPIDLIIEAFSDDSRNKVLAYEQAAMRFSGLLESLAKELPLLRAPIGISFPILSDVIAQRMTQAVWPYRDDFVTPMAAVAGAVADEILQALVAGQKLQRAYVNNGGDIAIYLSAGEKFQVGIAGIEDAEVKGQFTIYAEDPVRGIATSGWRGRSFSRGIADSVTVLAENAAMADAAATMIANAVNVDHPDIERAPACDIQAESDLGRVLITRSVPQLDRESINQALEFGQLAANKYFDEGLIERAAIRLQGEVRIVPKVGPAGPRPPRTRRSFRQEQETRSTQDKREIAPVS